MHSATAPCIRVQSGFKDSTKNSRADLRPVEILTSLTQQQINDFLREPRNNDVFISEQTAVDIGESRQIFIHIGITIFDLGVQYPEQINQTLTDILGLESL